MRPVAKALLSSVVTVISASAAFGQSGPVLVTAPAETIFVPVGFDDNDNVEVALHGHFSNTCYKIGPASVSVDQDAMTVSIDAQSYHYAGSLCAQVLVPFIQPVQLGVLKEGTYKVSQANSSILPVELTVGRSRTSDPDDFHYAPVVSADYVADAAGGKSVRLEGEWPLTFVGCMVMKEVRISETSGNVLLVLPIAEFTDGDACLPQRDSRKFVIDTPVTVPLTEGDHLLHSRALNGNSVNRLIEIGGTY